MKVRKENSAPPRWAERFLEWYCRPQIFEDLNGDLNEYFHRNLKNKGTRYARFIYVIDVLKFIRPYTIEKPDFINLIIQWIMIGSYIKTSGRNIVRNKLFSSINIIGLAVSMSVGLLLISFINDLLSYDQFNKYKSRIYRVIDDYTYQDQKKMKFASTSIEAGKRIREVMPRPEDVVILRTGFGGDVQYSEKQVPVSGLWADNSIFNVFTFPLLQGSAANALKDPWSIVLVEETARKIFGDKNALGKTVILNDHEYTITGILKNIPQFSHIQFEALGSFSTQEILEKHTDEDFGFWGWGSIWSNYVYLLLPENWETQTLQDRLDQISNIGNANAKDQNYKITLYLQPLSKIVLGESLSNQIGSTMTGISIWVIGGLTLVVLLSACFNYTNLSIARSTLRSREVGIRKIIGALKSQLWIQFITESILISVFALLFAFGLFIFIRPRFLGLNKELEHLVALNLSPELIFYFVFFAILVGLFAGVFPAIFYAKTNAIKVLKNTSSVKAFRHINLRKVLIVSQYTFSMIFITATLIGYKQYSHAVHMDLGFNTSNILNIKLQNNKTDFLSNELSLLPEVIGLSTSMKIESTGTFYGNKVKNLDTGDSISTGFNSVDEDYIPLHDFNLVAGRNFSSITEDAQESEVIVNQQLIKQLEIGNGNPDSALGSIIKVDSNQLLIVGVVKDFHYRRIDNEIGPYMFRNKAKDGRYINVKLVTDDMASTMKKINAIWRKEDNVHPLEATFYDDQIQQNYNEYAVMINVIGVLAFLTIVISSIGLFGMVVFSTGTKIKEIGIRKVLGASENNLVFLLGKNFLLL